MFKVYYEIDGKTKIKGLYRSPERAEEAAEKVNGWVVHEYMTMKPL